MSEEYKAKVRQVAEAFGSGKVEAFDELIAPEFFDHNPMPDQASGIQGMKDMATMFKTAFPDISVTMEDMIAEGDKVVGRMTMTGTNTGEFNGT